MTLDDFDCHDLAVTNLQYMRDPHASYSHCIVTLAGFMKEHPDEASEIVAKAYNLEPEVARSAVRNLITSVTKGVPYWGEGEIHLEGLKRMIDAQRSVGAITGDVDYSKIIDTRFLPDDLKAIK